MEIVIYPQMFNVQPSHLPGNDGPVPIMSVVVVDGGGTAVRVQMVLEDWEKFQAVVADPEGGAAALEARAKILAPGKIPPVRNGLLP